MIDRRIFPDDLAASLKERGVCGKPYRPSNFTEGEIFRESYCTHCFRNEPEKGGGCDIAVETFWLAVDDPKYPKEWVYGDDGQPTCTAFKVKK